MKKISFTISGRKKSKPFTSKTPYYVGRKNRHNPWTEDDVNLLKKLCDEGATWSQIAAALHRTPDEVRYYTRSLGFKNNIKSQQPLNMFNKWHEPYHNNQKWTIKDVQILTEMCGEGTSWEDIGKRLNRTAGSAMKRASNLDIANNYRYKPKTFHKKPWTQEEVEILRTEWHKGTKLWAISEILKRTRSAVRSKRNELDLPKRIVRYEISQDLKEKYDAGHLLKDLAKEAGVSKVILRKSLNMRRYRTPLTEDEISIITERHVDGCLAGCIAKRINRSHRTVERYIENLFIDENDHGFDAVIEDLLNSGFSLYQISTKLELPIKYITTALARIQDKASDGGAS